MNREHNILHFIKRDPIIPTIFAAAYRNKIINLEYRYVMRKRGGGVGTLAVVINRPVKSF
jgi:hypothetical protein